MPRRAFPCGFLPDCVCILRLFALLCFLLFLRFLRRVFRLPRLPVRNSPGADFSGFFGFFRVFRSLRRPGSSPRTALCRFGPFPHVPARKKSFWAADSSHPCPARPAFRSPRLSPAPSVWASLPFRRNPAPLFWAFRLFRRNPAPSVLSFPRFRQKGKIVGKRTVCPIRKGSRKPKKPEKKPPEPVPKGGKEIFRRSEVLF